MAELFSVLARRVLPRLGQSAPQGGGLRKWFEKGSYAGSFDAQTGNIVLSNVNPSELIDYLAFDYERFAFASWESFLVARLESETRSLVAWPLLKLYYSSFFAAHALMRSAGSSIVRIGKEQADTINLIVQSANGASPKIKQGMQSCIVGETIAGRLTVTLKPHAEGNGVHDGFWKAFADHLDDLANSAVAARDAEATNFVAGVAELTPLLRGWIAARRNDINYQQSFGVWYPVTRARQVNEVVDRAIRLNSSAIDLTLPTQKTIACFVKATQFLACLNAEIADHVTARSRASGTFGNRWSRFIAERALAN